MITDLNDWTHEDLMILLNSAKPNQAAATAQLMNIESDRRDAAIMAARGRDREVFGLAPPKPREQDLDRDDGAAFEYASETEAEEREIKEPNPYDGDDEDGLGYMEDRFNDDSYEFEQGE